MLGNPQYQSLIKNNTQQLYVQQQSNVAAAAQGASSGIDGQAAMSSTGGKISVGQISTNQVQGQQQNSQMLTKL